MNFYFRLKHNKYCKFQFFHRNNKTFIWAVKQNGEFTVKSAYKFLKERRERLNSNYSHSSLQNGVWNKLWRVKTVPRQTHLIWRILHNRLPVRSVLFNRGVQCSPLCCLCDQQQESINHLFMECGWSKAVWFASPLGLIFDINGGEQI